MCKEGGKEGVLSGIRLRDILGTNALGVKGYLCIHYRNKFTIDDAPSLKERFIVHRGVATVQDQTAGRTNMAATTCSTSAKGLRLQGADKLWEIEQGIREWCDRSDRRVQKYLVPNIRERQQDWEISPRVGFHEMNVHIVGTRQELFDYLPAKYNGERLWW